MAKDSEKKSGTEQNQGKKFPDNDNHSLGDEFTFADGNTSSKREFKTTVSEENFEMEKVDLSKRYRIESILGKGGVGEVFLATDLRLSRKVAIKRLLGDATKSKTAINRFLTEAKSIAALSHPNIVHINDYGSDKNGPFLIMEYVDGGSLLDRCREGVIPTDEALNLISQLCDGLSKAHELGMIHRDIKPANILLTKDGKPKLTDFGLAKVKSEDQSITKVGAVFGTLDFMSPEQRKDVGLIDPRSDLWSLAATLYQMVTGEPPRVIDLSLVPEQIRSLLAKALKTRKEERFQSVKEFRESLRSCTQQIVEIYFEEGSCPKCATKNTIDRKYCRKESCGGELEVICFSCSAKIPVWEKICGKCGGKQRDFLKKRHLEILSQQTEAEDLLQANNFWKANKIAIALRDERDPRLVYLKAWSASFLIKVEKAKEYQIQVVADLVKEALRLEQAKDYESAVQVLERVPEILRGQALVSLGGKSAIQVLEWVKRKKNEIERLENIIRQRVSTRNFKGLLEEVDQLLRLIPNQTKMLKIKQQLIKRDLKKKVIRDEVYTLAEKLVAQGKAFEALKCVERVKDVEITEDQSNLRSKIQVMVNEERELSKIANEVKLDSINEPFKIINLFLKSMDYLELNPNHTNVMQFHKKLGKRLPVLLKDFHSKVSLEQLLKLPNRIFTHLPALRNSIGMIMRLVPSGMFEMGWESDRHQVKLTKPFYLGVTVVTQEQYERVMGINPSNFKGHQNPVDMISWEDAMEFCRRLSQFPGEKSEGRVYRLPTEAEWEYTCRADTKTKFSFGDSEDQLCDYGWYAKNSGRTTHPVKYKMPNAWGFYDMHGNVWEWCSDWYDSYPKGEVVDPVGPSNGSYRVFRGGGWNDEAAFCGSANRFRYFPTYRLNNYGFRVALSCLKVPFKFMP